MVRFTLTLILSPQGRRRILSPCREKVKACRRDEGETFHYPTLRPSNVYTRVKRR